IGHIDAKHLADAREPSHGNAVRPALVFLHLLEGDADLVSQLGLRQAARDALHAHQSSDFDVDVVRSSRISCLGRHRSILLYVVTVLALVVTVLALLVCPQLAAPPARACPDSIRAGTQAIAQVCGENRVRVFSYLAVTTKMPKDFTIAVCITDTYVT